jgi:hypothetical protein
MNTNNNSKREPTRVIPSAGGGGLVNQVTRVDQTYTITVDSVDRTLDASAANDVAKLSDVLATLIQDLKTSGIIK